MEKRKQKTVDRLVHDVDSYAFEAEHQEVCEYAIEIGGAFDGLLTDLEAIELMGVLQRQVSARNRIVEELGKIARRDV